MTRSGDCPSPSLPWIGPPLADSLPDDLISYKDGIDKGRSVLGNHAMYYLHTNGEQSGPYSTEQLRQMAAVRKLQSSDLLWAEGMSEWQPAATIPGIFAASPPPMAGTIPPPPAKSFRFLGCSLPVLIFLLLLATGLVAFVIFGGSYYMVQQGELLKTAMQTHTESDIRTIATQLMVYNARNGQYPTTEQGLDALVHKPTLPPVSARWTNLMDEIPLDPWNHPYRYRSPAQKSPKPYDLYSLGPDGVEGTADDIGNWPSAQH